MRSIYYLIVHSHPRAFRTRFGGEMMSIFDEQQRNESVTELIIDGLCSLTRQWFSTQVLWTFAGAMSIASLQACWIARVLQKTSTSGQNAVSVADKPGAMMLTAVTVCGFLVMATAVGVWTTYFLRHRVSRTPFRLSRDAARPRSLAL